MLAILLVQVSHVILHVIVKVDGHPLVSGSVVERQQLVVLIQRVGVQVHHMDQLCFPQVQTAAHTGELGAHGGHNLAQVLVHVVAGRVTLLEQPGDKQPLHKSGQERDQIGEQIDEVEEVLGGEAKQAAVWRAGHFFHHGKKHKGLFDA